MFLSFTRSNFFFLVLLFLQYTQKTVFPYKISKRNVYNIVFKNFFPSFLGSQISATFVICVINFNKLTPCFFLFVYHFIQKKFQNCFFLIFLETM
jgi:hypothetical protein